MGWNGEPLGENASPIYGDMGMVGRGSPAGGAGGSTGIPTGSPNMAALSPGARGGMANLGGPAMAAMAAMASGSGSGPGVPGGPHNVKMHRYLPPTMIQQQQMYGSMDPRMMMIMGRGMPPGAAAMMRGPMHHFRPRFM
ncbi:hypothetical protein E2C01_005394 [Portunus trituberculatus]|uniref:Uncharacterized protein n=1 Tax=Portunus trituberculatus TaxID=210409 RepID=A0A5B7CT86_PORTR|nr:hypothetical protein [Portunus trituberculatus]